MTEETSILPEDQAECGCTDGESTELSQGMVPVTGVFMETTSQTTGSYVPATFTVGGVTPTTVTFNFAHYPGHTMGPMTSGPNTVVKVMDNETVVKVPDSGIKIKVESDEPGCYLEDGFCVACGY